MTFHECINALGVAEFPEYLPALYLKLEGEGKLDSCELVSDEFVFSMNEKHSFLTVSLDSVIESVRAMRKRNEIVRYVNLLAAALLDRETVHKFGLPTLPLPSKEDAALNFIGLAAMFPAMEKSASEMLERQFKEEVIRDNFKHYEYCINAFFERNGFYALDSVYFGWLQRYLDCIIMEFGGFRFEMLKSYHRPIVFLKNRVNGECVCLMQNVFMHRDGAVLGSADYTDETGSYFAEFSESDEAFYGYPCDKFGFCIGKKCKYLLTEWEMLLSQGGECINIHLPKGANLKGEAFSDACRKAVELFAVSYPDFKPSAFVCCSWLLDPRIDEVCGGAPNILNFQSKFYLFPIKDSGMDVFKFVFLKPFKTLDELPEDTRLMRGIKKRYKDGKHILDFGGVFPV